MNVLEKPVFTISSTLDPEEVTKFIQTMAQVLNKKDGHIISKENKDRWSTSISILYQKGDDSVPLDLTVWGVDHWSKNKVARGITIHFGRYDSQRIMFKNPNRFFALVDKIVDYLKSKLDSKLQDQINCVDQKGRWIKHQVSDRKEVIENILGKDPKTIPSYNTLSDFTAHTIDRKKTLQINIQDKDNTKSSIKTQDIEIVKRLLEVTDADIYFSVVVNGNSKTLKSVTDAVFDGEEFQV